TPGKFLLTGVVREAGLPVADATVATLDGSRAVLSTKSGVDGTYRLFDVPGGNVEVRASKDGYTEQVNRLNVSANGASDFVLAQTGPINVAGSYQLAVTARTGCNGLPPEARARTYAATITQNGPQLNVALSGATLKSGTFSGRIQPGSVTFDLRGV